jgi:hypothetical protein
MYIGISKSRLAVRKGEKQQKLNNQKWNKENLDGRKNRKRQRMSYLTGPISFLAVFNFFLKLI